MIRKKLIISFAFIMLLSGCSNISNENPFNPSIYSESVDEEHVNYRLWYYLED